MIFTLRSSPPRTERRLSLQGSKGYSSLSTPNCSITESSYHVSVVCQPFWTNFFLKTGANRPFLSLIAVPLGGVPVDAGLKHLIAAKFQQLSALHLVKGDHPPLRIHPNAPKGLLFPLGHCRSPPAARFPFSAILCDYRIKCNMHFLHILEYSQETRKIPWELSGGRCPLCVTRTAFDGEMQIKTADRGPRPVTAHMRCDTGNVHGSPFQ